MSHTLSHSGGSRHAIRLAPLHSNIMCCILFIMATVYGVVLSTADSCLKALSPAAVQPHNIWGLLLTCEIIPLYHCPTAQRNNQQNKLPPGDVCAIIRLHDGAGSCCCRPNALLAVAAVALQQLTHIMPLPCLRWPGWTNHTSSCALSTIKVALTTIEHAGKGSQCQ